MSEIDDLRKARDAGLFTALRLYTDELAELRAMRDGLEALHVDAQRWITESNPMPNLRAADLAVRWRLRSDQCNPHYASVQL